MNSYRNIRNHFLRVIAALLAVLMLAFCFVGCDSMALKPTKESVREVGTVGNFAIYYDELYFLVSTFRKELDAKLGEDAATKNEKVTVLDESTGEEKEVVLSAYYYEELERLVYENIVANYAVLTLCEDAGIDWESKDYEESVQYLIDQHISEDMAGDRSAYLDELEAMGSTDRYVRFSRRVDLLYKVLKNHYVKEGILETDEEKLRRIIDEEFIRTCHIMILNGDHDPANLAFANEALNKIESGTSMYDMIGSRYNHDYNLTMLDGYYFTRGSMDKAYEDAAFALDIHEKSGIVEAKGEDANGNRVDCYYVIQRLEMSKDYIDANLVKLVDEYHNASVNLMVEDVKENLRFTPNEEGSALDLLALEPPVERDPMVAIVVAVVIGSVLAVGAVAVLIVCLIRKRKKNILSKAVKLHGKKG